MSGFADKVFSGLRTTDAEWTKHLLEAHARMAGQTPKVLAQYRTAAGSSSYDLIVDTIARQCDEAGTKLHIVDLACGDGYLIELLLDRLGKRAQVTGVDMSDAELALAQERLQRTDARLLQESAQHLSLPDRSVDVVSCHLAFMLMTPVVPVVHEVARVLRPRGLFAAVVNRVPVVGPGQPEDQLLVLIREQIRKFLAVEFPAMQGFPIGDARVATLDGLKQLFNSRTGYIDLETSDFEIQIDGTAESLWDFFGEGTYVVAALDANRKAALKAQVLNALRDLAATSDSFRMNFPMRQIVATRLE